MRANSPADICEIFKHAMARGDLEAVLSVYDPEAVFAGQSGDVTEGAKALQQALAPLATAKARFSFSIKKVVEAGGIALMHTEWTISGDPPLKVYAIEVARRQADGAWKWLIGDPYTVDREHAPPRQTA